MKDERLTERYFSNNFSRYYTLDDLKIQGLKYKEFPLFQGECQSILFIF
jgi:hypothetical protein